MAEHNSAQERTEQATAKRLDDARDKGQLPRSRELGTMLVLLAAAVALSASWSRIVGEFSDVMVSNLRLSRAVIFDPNAMLTSLALCAAHGLNAIAPFLLAMMIAATAGGVLLGGFAFAPEAIGFKWERLDPIQGFLRLVSLRSVVEVVKAIAKFLLLLSCGLGVLWAEFDSIRSLSRLDLQGALGIGLELTFRAFVAVSGGTVVIALLDVPYQWWEHHRNLRMSRQEVRDELKESEGSPEVRQRVRAMQQELASRRMMEEVPKADVVITNPTHYAVALRFDPESMAAPKLVAKGSDNVAFRIRELALAHGVTIVDAPPLARAIFHSTKLGREIPAGLYVAVAQVLAYVFQIKRGRASADAPVLPRDLPIPPELQR
ncbi:MAG: flagellar biosynthesis protein FlhB [Gammaproteobacteria bacterium]